MIDSDFVWPAQYFQCLREVLCDPMFGDTGDKMFGDTGDPTCFLCGRCFTDVWMPSVWLYGACCVTLLLFGIVHVIKKLGEDPFLCGRCNNLREGHRNTALKAWAAEGGKF